MSQGSGRPVQLNISLPPWTPMIKRLTIINGILWFTLVLVLQQGFMSTNYIFQWFGLVPATVISDFWVWQPFSYMWLHSAGPFHFVLNFLFLWMFGGELEARWGGKFFLLYYLVSGIGAGILYLFGMVAYYLISGSAASLSAPVIGASGAVYGVMMAYALIFGERVIYFMMIIPMKAKYFVLVVGGFELISLMSSDISNNVANLAHLGGLVSGFIFLKTWRRWLKKAGGSPGKRKKSGLRLVVDNQKDNDKNDPKYWN